MTRVFVRRDLDPKQTTGALLVSLGVAAITFYVARVFLARDAVELEPPTLEPPPDVQRLSKGKGLQQ